MSEKKQKQPKAMLSTRFPEIAKEWSPRNKVKPSEVLCSSPIKVWWVCSEKHSWKAVVKNRVYNGNNCPKCSKRGVRGSRHTQKPKSILAYKFPEAVAEWSPKNTIKPTEICHGSSTKVWWVCSEGHEWQDSPNYRTHHGVWGSAKLMCPICSTNRRAHRGVHKLPDTHPELVREWSPKNILKPSDVSFGSRKKVWWLCPEGHAWECEITLRTRRDYQSRCPVCKAQEKNNV